LKPHGGATNGIAGYVTSPSATAFATDQWGTSHGYDYLSVLENPLTQLGNGITSVPPSPSDIITGKPVPVKY